MLLRWRSLQAGKAWQGAPVAARCRTRISRVLESYIASDGWSNCPHAKRCRNINSGLLHSFSTIDQLLQPISKASKALKVPNMLCTYCKVARSSRPAHSSTSQSVCR